MAMEGSFDAVAATVESPKAAEGGRGKQLTKEERQEIIEALLARSASHTGLISKVMFLCAVNRPRWDTTRNALFDGKIGIWPFTTKEAARRSSRNSPRGTLMTKPLNVTTEVYREEASDFCCSEIKCSSIFF